MSSSEQVPPPGSAAITESQLQRLVEGEGKEALQRTQRFVLVLFQGFPETPHAELSTGLVANLRWEFEDQIVTTPDEVEIDVWLESLGGDAHAAYKLALLLRAYSSKVRVVVPDIAKSAATLLALGADEIYMAPAAELGPLDAQIEYEQEGHTVSALDIARSVEDLMETGSVLGINVAQLIQQHMKLSRLDSLTSGLDFSSEFLNPVLSKIDPTKLHWSQTLLQVAQDYASRVLGMRVGSDAMDEHFDDLPRALVEDYPTHEFVISPEEALSRGLPVRPLAEYDRALAVRKLHRKFEASRTNRVRLCGPKEDPCEALGVSDA